MTATRTAEPAAAFDGVVLAGGRSSRMGTDKAGLPWRGCSSAQAAQLRSR